MTPDVSVIIVSWNVREVLQRNLQRMLSLATQVTNEVIVVDNGSADGTPAMVRSFFPRVELIQNDTNRGFAFACNQGLRQARGRVLVLFNPDMLMGEGVLEHVVATLENCKEIGVMGVKLMGIDRTVVVSVRRDPGLLDQMAILLKIPHLFPRLLDRYLVKSFDYEHDSEVEQLRGSFFAFRREVMEKVGFLDADNFFLWFEEVDYCRRVREAGWKIWYSAKVACTDLVGQAFKQQPTALKQARFSKSMARYFFKWHGWWAGALVSLLRPVAIALGAVADLFVVRSKT